ncbi:hypothetical protein HQ865_03125 [Mucilaginibacter mali]|uniref:Uncharacterized protein n=1 Tax=Mucilaginibacter mali TaxID=2740462 RepID=A0A7D4QDF0_9SPHI|nr:hypothetical protein [Mucilaginibacter mali]QKJ28792.1 hypothetical protein HQ865_03125 [Mucilaginibacter mali]
MHKQIKVIITTDACDNCHAIKGKYENGNLHIVITYIGDLIYIIIDNPFSVGDVERCLNLLREKLYIYERLILKKNVMTDYNHAPTHSFFGGLIKGNFNKCFTAIHYYITYSLNRWN